MKNGPYELIIPPEDYPGKKYRDKYAYEHHVVYWKHTGYILKEGEEIHHKDGNKRKNEFENLELISHSDHTKKHKIGRTYITLICDFCGKEFQREKRQMHTNNKNYFCKKKCANKFNTIRSHHKKDNF